MALKDAVKDPLNWVLLVLAAAFGYYVVAIPYYQDLYLKTPQEMTMQEYLENPSHPRPFMLHALGTPPSSVEVIITDLTIRHIDSDSITLTSSSVSGGDDSGMTPGPADPTRPSATEAEGTATEGAETEGAATGGAETEGAETEGAETEGAATGGAEPREAGADEDAAQAETPGFGPEEAPPANEILIAGENMDLLEVSEGQQVNLQVFGLHESPLGWIPQEPVLESDVEERFSKEDLDELERLKIRSGGNVVRIPYVETGEFRFAEQVHEPGEAVTLAELEDDTNYIQTANRLAGRPVDLREVRLILRRQEQLSPYFIVEDEEGRRARVNYNQRILSEWYWAMDRLQGQTIVARGVLDSQLLPSDLRQLDAEENLQAILEGLALLSPDGAVVINLDNPAGGVGGPR